MHCPAVSHAGITVCPVIHWYSFTCIWAVNIRCSPQITHKCCTPPRPCLGHVTAAKYWTQVRKDPGGQCRIGRDIVRSRIDVQLSNVSWNHKRRDSVNVRLAADLKNWHFTGQHVHRGWVVYLSTKHQSSASSGYSLCHYFTINEKESTLELIEQMQELAAELRPGLSIMRMEISTIRAVLCCDAAIKIAAVCKKCWARQCPGAWCPDRLSMS